jgi:hypothetical protein
MNIEVCSKVKLNTFNGGLSQPEACDPSENYWALIGSTGTVIKSKNERGRVLVKFDIDISSLGLHCHNVIPNSLLILPADLEAL